MCQTILYFLVIFLIETYWFLTAVKYVISTFCALKESFFVKIPINVKT